MLGHRGKGWVDRHPVAYALLWLALALGFGGGAVATALQAHALATRGVLTTAVVLRTEEHDCRRCSDDVFVDFTDQDGREHRDVDVGDVRRPLPHVGAQWTIRYDAHDPSGLVQDARLSPDWIGPGLLALSSAAFLWCAWRAGRGRLPWQVY